MAFGASRARLLRVGLIAGWLVLLLLLIRRDVLVPSLAVREADVLSRGREESFVGVYFQNRRIGYVKSRLQPQDNKGFRLRQDALLRLNILGEEHPVRMQVVAELSPTALLQAFTFSLSSPFYHMAAQGMVQGTEIIFTLDTGKGKVTDRVKLANQPYLPTSQRSYLLSQGLNPGDRIKIPYFDPFSLAGHDTVLTYQGREKVLISGRVHNLHRFVEAFAGIRINSWLDDSGRVIKEESPAGFVFLAEPEFKATDLPGDVPEILSAMAVSLSGTMPADLATRRELRYRLDIPAEAELDIDGGRQRFAAGILTVHRESLPPQDSGTNCPDAQKFLTSSPHIQKDDPAIVALAQAISAEETTWLGRTRALAAWVYGNLEKRPVVGIPDAATVLGAKAGDCNEHAVLFAALARSIGIPAKIVAGVTFSNNAFYYHAWNEVCLGDDWLSLDTTLNQLPADLTHLRMVEGETREMIRIGALLGRLRITALPELPAHQGASR